MESHAREESVSRLMPVARGEAGHGRRGATGAERSVVADRGVQILSALAPPRAGQMPGRSWLNSAWEFCDPR